MRIRPFIVSSLALSFSLGMTFLQVPHVGLEHFQQVQAQAANTLYVDATKGNSAGPGNAQAPFKTITAALQAAVPGTVIQVQPGKYDEANGEVFPLVVRTGVTLQGDVNTRGKDTLIQGGGKFLSPTVAGQVVGLVAQKGTTIQGLTISNPQKRGYGIWVEGTDPTINRNILTGSGNDGVMLTGTAAGKITDNFFYKNPSDGITMLRTASPLIQGNIFEDTGFAMNIDEKSSPVIKDNVVFNNADGIVILGKSTPTLRGNRIESNRRSGIAIVGAAQPNLGTAAERGANYFHKNLKSDINNATRPQIPLSAMGNEHTAKPKFLGSVQGDNPPVIAAKSAPTLPSASVIVPTAAPAAATTATASPTSPSQKPLPPKPPSQLPLAKPPTAATQTLPAPTTPPPAPPIVPKPLPPGNLQTPAAKPLPPQPAAPLPPPATPVRQSQAPQLPTLPPPASANKPLPPQFGDSRPSQPEPKPAVQTAQQTQTVVNKPLASKPEVVLVDQSSPGTGKYRVLITDASPDLRKLKQFVKNPFHREHEGRKVLQVGVFSSASSAQQIIKQLISQGFKAIVARV
jgi:parallel beta-helix repeat protein